MNSIRKTSRSRLLFVVALQTPVHLFVLCRPYMRQKYPQDIQRETPLTRFLISIFQQNHDQRCVLFQGTSCLAFIGTRNTSSNGLYTHHATTDLFSNFQLSTHGRRPTADKRHRHRRPKSEKPSQQKTHSVQYKDTRNVRFPANAFFLGGGESKPIHRTHLRIVWTMSCHVCVKVFLSYTEMVAAFQTCGKCIVDVCVNV